MQRKMVQLLQARLRCTKKQLDDAWAKYRKAIQWFELESNLETAQARLEQAQRDYTSLTDPSFNEDTAGARAALANAEVRAPFAGIIAWLIFTIVLGTLASALPARRASRLTVRDALAYE